VQAADSECTKCGNSATMVDRWLATVAQCPTTVQRGRKVHKSPYARETRLWMGAVNTPSSLVPATPAPTHDRTVLMYRSDPWRSAALSALLPAAATAAAAAATLGRLLLARGAAPAALLPMPSASLPRLLPRL